MEMDRQTGSSMATCTQRPPFTLAAHTNKGQRTLATQTGKNPTATKEREVRSVVLVLQSCVRSMRFYDRVKTLVLHYFLATRNTTTTIGRDNTTTSVMTTPARNYSGNYTLVSLYDNVASASIVVPEPSPGRQFSLRLVPSATSSSVTPPGSISSTGDQTTSRTDQQQYDVFIQLGNSMRTRLNVTFIGGGGAIGDADEITGVSPLVSTRILPSPDVRAVESAVTRILPGCTHIRFVNSTVAATHLLLDGPSGAMDWAKIAEPTI